ncbi:hypothetical protein GCM10010522_40860 [Kribbella solani]
MRSGWTSEAARTPPAQSVLALATRIQRRLRGRHLGAADYVDRLLAGQSGPTIARDDVSDVADRIRREMS